MTVISVSDFHHLLAALGDIGRADVEWAETIGAPANSRHFATETIFVICNSGMRNTVAVQIYDRVIGELNRGGSASAAFGHAGKTGAIDTIWRDRDRLYREFMAADDKLAYCETLPWIGGITKYHLAKNFGVDCAKPDVHLQRLADREGITAQALCERLASATGYRVATVDTILWRACANGVLNSKTGEISP